MRERQDNVKSISGHDTAIKEKRITTCVVQQHLFPEQTAIYSIQEIQMSIEATCSVQSVIRS